MRSQYRQYVKQSTKTTIFHEKLKSSGASQTDLKQQIEAIQRRMIHIIFPYDNYTDGLSKLNLVTLEDRTDKSRNSFVQ